MFLTEEQFNQIWRRVHLIFGLNAPEDDRKELCSRIVREKIDPRAIPLIKSRIDQLEAKPRNVASFFLAVAAEWKSKNPEMQTRPGSTCAACEDGVIYMLKPRPLDKKPSLTSGTCGHCQPHDAYTWTKQSIEACGMQWVRPGWQIGFGGELIWPCSSTAPVAPKAMPTAQPLPYDPKHPEQARRRVA